jgi:predicted Zn-dependent protease
VDAIALYERGVHFLQARQYKEAAEALRGVIDRFPDEKELHERARLYIRVCERGIAAAPHKPESPEERVYAATLAINNGSPDQAITILGAVLHKDPENDHATYMMGVAQALKGNAMVAMQYLARSMALNRENRDLAFKEPDLEALRRTDEMRALLASPPAQLPRRDGARPGQKQEARSKK